MDVFSSVENRVKGPAPQRSSLKRDERGKSPRQKRYSDSEIREKLLTKNKDTDVELSKKARNHPGLKAKETSASGSEFVSDVNPEQTKEKLVKVLENGAFEFNDKERMVLEEILNRS